MRAACAIQYGANLQIRTVAALAFHIGAAEQIAGEEVASRLCNSCLCVGAFFLSQRRMFGFRGAPCFHGARDNSPDQNKQNRCRRKDPGLVTRRKLACPVDSSRRAREYWMIVEVPLNVGCQL